MGVADEQLERAAAQLDSRQFELSEAITQRHYQENPALEARYGPAGRLRCREDAALHLAFLSQSVAMGTPGIFVDYICWAKVMLAARGIPGSDLTRDLEAMERILQEKLPQDLAHHVGQHIRTALEALPTAAEDAPCEIRDDAPRSPLARQYLAALLDYDRATAKKVILSEIARGLPVKSLYEEVFTPVQVEIGRLWQTNKITVAEEHYCTAATELIMAQVYAPDPGGEKNGRRMVGMCTTRELHDLGARMVCDFFEMEGWDTAYLGANVPVSSAVRMIRARKPDLVAISAAIPYHIRSVGEMIRAMRAEFDSLKIIVGGGAFKLPGLWRKIGADAYAQSPSDAVEKANQLLDR
jgi:MerR family transcriptional regulator, light-induced transcriptional regulator